MPEPGDGPEQNVYIALVRRDQAADALRNSTPDSRRDMAARFVARSVDLAHAIDCAIPLADELATQQGGTTVESPGTPAEPGPGETPAEPGPGETPEQPAPEQPNEGGDGEGSGGV